jgi:formate hydrogenlyase subunit 3/multisubunit Na+/H+ antiporter MnhD subunit
MAPVNAAVMVFLGAPLLAGFLSLAIRNARLLHGLNLATMASLVVAELALTGRVLAQGPITALWDLVYVDALSAFILFIIAAIGLTCSLYTWSYLDDYVARGVLASHRLSRFFFLFHLFLFAMIAATMANSLGVLWVAIEGTTLATTFLIAFFRKREGLEAGWKYLILGGDRTGPVRHRLDLLFVRAGARRRQHGAQRHGASGGGGSTRSARAQAGLHLPPRRLWHEDRAGADACLGARGL